MESLRTKKVAAAVAAVLQYTAESESPGHAVAETLAAPASPPAPGSWGLVGRQEAMGFRILWQRRLSKSW